MLLTLAVLSGCGGDDQTDLVGRAAPDFTLATVGGRDVTLSDLRGQAVIVDFWATWCPPCQALMPELQSLAEAHAGRLSVVAVSVDGDPGTVVPAFAAEHGYTITMTADARGQDVARAWGGTKGIPCTYLVDGNGIVRFHWLGKHDRSDYDRAIREVLAAGE